MTREPFYTWRVAVGDTQIPMLHYRQKTTRLQWLCLMKMVLFILIIKAIHDHKSNSWSLYKTVTVRRNKKKVKTTDESTT